MFAPIKDRIILKQVEAEEKTKGGLLIPDEAKCRAPRGEVLAIGPEVKDVKVGDVLIMVDKWFSTFKHEGQEYVVINEPDVVAILKEVA